MTKTEQPTKTFAAIYVTISKNGTPRFSTFWRGRLWPTTREIAEASFAAGATIYRKQAGQSLWTEGACEVIG